MNKFSGIDLHSNNSMVVVSDEVDRIVPTAVTERSGTDPGGPGTARINARGGASRRCAVVHMTDR